MVPLIGAPTFDFALLNWMKSGGGKWRSLSLSLSRSFDEFSAEATFFLPFSGNSSIHAWSFAEAQLQPSSSSSLSPLLFLSALTKDGEEPQFAVQSEPRLGMLDSRGHLFSKKKYTYIHICYHGGTYTNCPRLKATGLCLQKMQPGIELWLQVQWSPQEWLALFAFLENYANFWNSSYNYAK